MVRLSVKFYKFRRQSTKFVQVKESKREVVSTEIWVYLNSFQI